MSNSPHIIGKERPPCYREDNSQVLTDQEYRIIASHNVNRMTYNFTVSNFEIERTPLLSYKS